MDFSPHSAGGKLAQREEKLKEAWPHQPFSAVYPARVHVCADCMPG